MATRIDLHRTLCQTLGSSHVYFQPPESVKLCYPCIVYKLNRLDTEYADDNPYRLKDCYTLTVITKDPDSTVPRDISMLPMTKFVNAYIADNLYHSTIQIYI